MLICTIGGSLFMGVGITAVLILPHPNGAPRMMMSAIALLAVAGIYGSLVVRADSSKSRTGTPLPTRSTAETDATYLARRSTGRHSA